MTDGARRPGGLPRDIAAGVLLVALGGFGLLATGDLAIREGDGIGPGLMPRGVAALLAFTGVVVALAGIATRSDRVRLGSLRGPVFVLGAVVLFAATVRPLGLAIATVVQHTGEIVEAVRAAGARAVPRLVDTADSVEVAHAFADVSAAEGRVDVVCNHPTPILVEAGGGRGETRLAACPAAWPPAPPPHRTATPAGP